MSEITLEGLLRDILYQMSRADGQKAVAIANCFIKNYLNMPCFKLPVNRLNELAKVDSNGEGIKTCENCKEVLSERQMYINACEQIKALQNLLQKRNEMLKEKDKILCGHNHDRLNELAKADREERCVILPVKIGDFVYMPLLREILRLEIVEINAKNYIPVFKAGNAGLVFSFDEDDIGKGVFLTREEAEQELKERENK